jgi:cytochrome P450
MSRPHCATCHSPIVTRLSGVIHHSDLSDVEITMFAALLLGAGFITTTHVFGNAVVALVRHRDQLVVLQEHPEGRPNAVEEILRYDTAIQLLARVATETVDIEGQTIRAGQVAYLLVGGLTETRRSLTAPMSSTRPASTPAST